MKVDVLGTTYKIKTEKFGGENCDGWTDTTSKVICIRADNYNQVVDFDSLMRRQLRHELIHAFLHESGLSCNFEHVKNFGHEETMVDWIAIQFPKIYKTYKKLNILE